MSLRKAAEAVVVAYGHSLVEWTFDLGVAVHALRDALRSDPEPNEYKALLTPAPLPQPYIMSPDHVTYNPGPVEELASAIARAKKADAAQARAKRLAKAWRKSAEGWHRALTEGNLRCRAARARSEKAEAALKRAWACARAWKRLAKRLSGAEVKLWRDINTMGDRIGEQATRVTELEKALWDILHARQRCDQETERMNAGYAPSSAPNVALIRSYERAEQVLWKKETHTDRGKESPRSSQADQSPGANHCRTRK